MRKYSLIPHTADIRLFVEGDSLEALFTVALVAVNSILKKDGCVGKDVFPIREGVTLVTQDTTALLVEFLSEVVSRSYANRALFCTVMFLQLSALTLTCQLAGIAVDGFDEDIKAVTYHEAEIKKNADGVYQTTIVLDI